MRHIVSLFWQNLLTSYVEGTREKTTYIVKGKGLKSICKQVQKKEGL